MVYEALQEAFSDHLFEGKVNLRDLTLDELKAFFKILGQSSYRAGQLLRWLYVRRARSFEEMTDLSHRLREKLDEIAVLPSLRLETPLHSLQDTSKFLFTLPDGNQVESVKMRYLEHLGPGRVAVCLSSQVGCAMGCAFCASCRRGLVRNLSAWEMADQAVQIQRLLDPLDERVANIVFMGIGEPLNNLKELLRAIELLNCGDGFGVGMRHIAVSTCGVVPGILKLAEQQLPLKLAISLHASNDELRSRLMPVNKRWPIAELIDACRQYQAATRRRITFEYVMLDGVNDNLKDADRLVKLLRGIRSLVNLIPWNPVDEIPFQRSSKNRVRAFQERVAEGGIRCTLRREKGSDINAACGQLRLRRMREIEEEFDAAEFEDED
ncbi:MAG: 23S rRNA (adenine(2503)-C(2))-methyltransferase RlmN [bacterium]|nr:23S rRNA (adenine(2503)-C(2))-methyltransferase RlmN [bacterium]